MTSACVAKPKRTQRLSASISSSAPRRSRAIACCGRAHRNQPVAKPVWILCLIAMGSFLSASTGLAAISSNGIGLPCKYSVRDVAFVNIHGPSWQLELIKPAGLPNPTLEAWNKILRRDLEHSNLGFAWHETDSTQAKRLGSQNESELTLILNNKDGVLIPVGRDSDFESQITNLLHSPARKQLLAVLPESLCVFLLIKSGDSENDRIAAKLVRDSIQQTERQMWMMEKASDQGPQLVEVRTDDERENWLLHTIGFDASSIQPPAVAVMYGQGRRLGEIISGSDLNQQTLVSRASICGSDCECRLDRDWLYGQQMVHVWTDQQRHAAEENLDFDPQSAFVMAEVAQILQKNSGTQQDSSLVDLGGGLVIHDLSNGSQDEPHSPSTAAESAGSSSEQSEAASQLVAVATKTKVAVPEKNTANIQSTVPWSLFVAMAAVTIVVILIRLKQP